MAGPVAGQNEEEPVHQTAVVRGRLLSGRPCSVGEAAKLIRDLLNKTTPEDDLEPRLPRVAAALELLAQQTGRKHAATTVAAKVVQEPAAAEPKQEKKEKKRKRAGEDAGGAEKGVKDKKKSKKKDK